MLQWQGGTRKLYVTYFCFTTAWIVGTSPPLVWLALQYFSDLYNVQYKVATLLMQISVIMHAQYLTLFKFTAHSCIQITET